MIDKFLKGELAIIVKNKDEAEKVKELAYNNGFKWRFGERDFNPFGFEHNGKFYYIEPQGVEMIIVIVDGKLMVWHEFSLEEAMKVFGQVISFKELGV